MEEEQQCCNCEAIECDKIDKKQNVYVGKIIPQLGVKERIIKVQ